MEANIMIVEGAAATGKTTLCTVLVRRIAAMQKVPSLHSFRQSSTYHPLNPDCPDSKPSPETTKKHLNKLLTQVVSLASSPGYILLESLVWTLWMRPGGLDRQWLSGYESKLADLGARVLLVSPTESRHRQQLLERSGTEFYGIYGRRYGHSESEVIEYYLNEQKAFRALARSSTLNSMILDTFSDHAVDQAFDFWAS